ncbi:hypothetical protein Ato02nite_057420 [Paractinoplanes toevensis]|uniref:Uncharacterized protein n=1 Tax=Paractinoplanes toevensis TaxID=571911 RepID=A0A919W4F6_9ACTN|nr:hypothetical protein Ato02nite_057420 [Actinoplanes toevensis]
MTAHGPRAEQTFGLRDGQHPRLFEDHPVDLARLRARNLSHPKTFPHPPDPRCDPVDNPAKAPHGSRGVPYREGRAEGPGNIDGSGGGCRSHVSDG